MRKEERIVHSTAEDIRKKAAKGETVTDWDALDAMTEEEIERNAPEDDLEDGLFDLDGPIRGGGLPGRVPAKVPPTRRLDEDVTNFFTSRGKGDQTRTNAVLRQFMEHEKRGTG